MSEKTYYLEKLLHCLQDSYRDVGDYYIPEIWNPFGYRSTHISERSGEIKVEPFQFYEFYINKLLKQKFEKNTRKTDIIYCAQIRSFTAWNHNGIKIQNGSFLKAILLLPRLKEMGIDTIYLLPIYRLGKAYRKGNAGSCYAIKNIYQISEQLHDELLGEYEEETIDMEFGAFVEACHICGIYVMLDFVFRTQSRDSDLILEHPDWFYWIDIKYKDIFSPITFNNIPKLQTVNREYLKIMYCDNIEKIQSYMTMFSESPDKKDEMKWNSIKENVTDEKDILSIVEEQFGITTAPAFSDVLNDFQDMWKDVTYLKLSFDLCDIAKKYLGDVVVPFIMQDSAKASVCCGDDINYELWKYISDVIPYYQTKFGLDGARIDMGHALPEELNQLIIQKCRNINQNFILWSEEHSIHNSKLAEKNKFDFISGSLWREFRKYKKTDFIFQIIRELKESKLPLLSQLDNPDSFRFAYVYEMKTAKQLLTLCFMLPRTKVMLMAGFEVEEKGPVNTGLEEDCNLEDILDKNDCMNGCQSLFDLYRIHWKNHGNINWSSLITSLFILRNKYITNESQIQMKQEKVKGGYITKISYSKENAIMVLFSICSPISYNSIKMLVNIKDSRVQLSFIDDDGEIRVIHNEWDMPRNENIIFVRKIIDVGGDNI